MKGTKIVCPANYTDANTFVDMPEEVKQALEGRKLRKEAAQKSTFIVSYSANFPENARSAFQRAVDIWAEILDSPVPVRVWAYWEPLGRNVLGSATSADFLRNFVGSKTANTWYPVALAEKMAGKDLNSINDPDVVAQFSSDASWYYGQTGTPAVGQFDFTSVVLHELCHGLGFISSMNAPTTSSSGVYGSGTGMPFVFDRYIQNEKSENLTDTLVFKNNTVALRNELISNSLYFDSPRTTAPVLDNKVKLYAPTVYEQGSSISHLDDRKYPAGTINSLMTPSARLREVNWNPGPITLNMFADMGWKGTTVVHEPIKDFATVQNVKVEAKILSDTTLVANGVKLYYLVNSEDLSRATQVVMTRDAGTGIYSATIPVTATGYVIYYITAEDHYNALATSPPSAPRYIWAFNVGTKDTWGPLIEHYPYDIVNTTNPISFLANVIDDYQAGIDTVYVNYAVNGQSRPSFGLKKFNINTDNKDYSQGRADDVAYLAENGIPPLAAGDRVTYQIVAIDKGGNKTVLPTRHTGTNITDPVSEAFYEFTASTLKSAVTEYFNDFEAGGDDFANIGFRVTKPEGFSTNALMSSSPYSNGLGLNDPVSGGTYLDFDHNDIAMLRVPIILKRDSATITFDEIVLVEPGENGSEFGDQDFYDYVVVEGNIGGNWYPLFDGYDSRADSNWERVFNSSATQGNVPNSTGKGTPALYKTRTINIYGGNYITNPALAGSQMLLRFRLYSDQFVNGWGWAIDNLAVQKPAPKPLANESVVKNEILTVSPNPAAEFVNLKLPVARPQKVKVDIFSAIGESVYSEEISVQEGELNKQLSVRSYAPGTYVARVSSDKGYVTKRFVVKK